MGHVRKISCCIEAEEEYTVKAQYALGMLLMPLGLKPKWVKREDLKQGGIYYGSSIDQIPRNIIRIPLHPETLSFFQHRVYTSKIFFVAE